MLERFGFDERKKVVKREKRKRRTRKVAVDENEPLTSVC